MAQAVDPAIETFARIKVVGVGGAGGAAINRMVEAGIDGVEWLAARQPEGSFLLGDVV